MKKHLFFLFVLSVFTFHFLPLQASDWVLNEDKYSGSHYTDHLYLEVFLADLDGGNTYCQEGTLMATNGSRTIDLLKLKYINQGDDESQTAEVKAKLVMSNAKAYFTNSSGSEELTTSEKSYWLYKWGSDNHYMTAKINLYYSAELAGGNWRIYFYFKHSDGEWYTRVLTNSVGTSTTLGLSDFNWKAYKAERTGLDQLTFTVPKLPSDIDSKFNGIRMRKCTYDVHYTFYKQDGSTVVVDKTYEASTTQEKTENCTFPSGLGNPKRIDYKVTATHGIKDPNKWFNCQTQTEEEILAFPVVPVPNAITTDFRQFDRQAVLTWTTPSSEHYMAVTPYVYRIETDESGTPLSGKSWSKRGNLDSTRGDVLRFTDDEVTIGTYFKYMAVNVPTDWINHGINESSLSNPSNDLLSKLGCSSSRAMNTAPSVSIYDMQQDTAVANKVRITWKYTRVPTSDATVSFKVLRRTSESGDWSELATISGDAKPAAGAKLSFEDTDLPNVSTRYQYKIRLELAGYRFESDVVTAGLLAGTKLTDFTATKGTHDASTTLSWSVKQTGTANCTYIISRRYVNSTGEFMSVHTENGANEHYTWEDNTVKPGYYYEYKIEVYDGGVLQNALYTVGFCQARGTVSGRVNFGNGNAVPNVRLWLRPTDSDDDNTVRSSSQYVYDASEGLTWQADATETANVFGVGKGYTLQFFVRPEAGMNAGAVLANIPGTGPMILGGPTNEGYSVRVADMTNGPTLPVGKYSLLTLSRAGAQVSLQVDTGEVVTHTCPQQNITSVFSLGGLVGITSSQAFKGNLAEVRVWDHVLTDAEKALYYDRTLNGRESGLMLYWPLDEGLQRYAFDASYSNDLPNGRHATVGNNITPSTTVPAEAQLARYGMTNEQGEYLIRGILFMGSGSGYTIVPEKGIHEFNPHTRSLFISPTSLTANNIDFEDVSSFPMTGHIYYAGTNVPAEGIQFYVDGIAVTANGKAQQTDANGYYHINVPIGEHYVEAKLEGHCLVDSGRFPIEGTYNFVDRVQHDFSDSTLVNFVGRVAGAKYNDTIPVGFAESKNNIGVATITLRLNNESFSFNCQNDYITPATTDRYYESDTVTIRSRAWTGSGDAANTKYIYITTDSATGEFSAKLPPLKYVMKSVEVASNDAIEFTSLPEVDLTNPRMELTDSIGQVTAQGDTVYNKYQYNTKKVLTYYAQPQVDVVETGHPAGVFGLDSLIVPIDETHNDTVRGLYTIDGEGVHYLFGYPIYEMMSGVEYELHAYEAYINKDGATPVTDTVNLNGQELIIGNEMSADQSVIYDVPEDSTQYTPGEIYQMKNHVLTLDQKGRARLPWTAGAPNIVSPFTRQFNVTLKRDDRTYEPFRMNTIVLGSLTTGNNFVTKGPDQVQFILRDPYGAKSKTTLKKGTVNTVTKYNTSHASGEHLAKLDFIGGANVSTANGMGIAVITTSNMVTDVTAGVKGVWKTTHRQDKIYQTTTVESYSTGDKYPYVGAKGDVFIGTANNILVGMCRKVHVKKNVQTGNYEIVLEDALAMGTTVSTIFAYSQYELETVMIPKWKDQRAQYLTQVATEAEARNYVNTSQHAKCVTWLSPSDPHYGDSATYVFVAPQDTLYPEKNERDSVEWCNYQIKEWEKYLRKNEEAKIKVMNEKTPQNYSIDGGSSRTFTFRNDTTQIDQTQKDYTVSFVGGWQAGWKIYNVTRLGLISNTQHVIGGGGVSGSGDDDTDYTEWDYVLEDGNRDADLSINMYDSENGSNSKIFSLFGGQTYNPYEPADSTHYYKPDGQSLPLGNGSVRMEQPVVQIGVGSSAPGKSATITDIPAGGSANAVLYCTNMCNTHKGVPFGYNVSVMENTDTTGLQILMDGVPINGRTIWLDNGITASKVLTIRQSDESILDHEGIKIRFLSQYQPASIYDEVTLNAHFTPSSSPVELTVTNPVINTDPTTGNGTLSLKVSGFNRLFKNLKNVGVQYRFAGNTQWTELYTWETSPADTAGTSHTLMPTTGDLRLTVDMSDNISYPEGDYEFRAFTTTPYGNEQIHVYSEVTQVIKDMTKPRPLFTPAPANGILGNGDQLSVEFNEDIVPGYVGDKNIIVTAKLNGRPINHAVSHHLVPFGGAVQTVNPVFLNGNFSMEFWLNWHEEGTILHQGAGNGNFSLSVDDAGHMTVSVVGMTFTSTQTLPKDTWAFVAMNYKAQTMTFNMLAQYGEVSTYLFQNQTVPMEHVEVVDYTEDNYLYLGPINANIHDLALYNIYRDVLLAAGDKYTSKDAYTSGLTNYWPMNEGHGHVAADTRRTHDFRVNDTWTIEGTNYALRTDTTTGAQVDISLINTGVNDSYALELWYQPGFNAVDTVFEATGLCLRYDSLTSLVLDYGTKLKTLATKEDFPDIMSGWNHFALNVVRGQAASFYLNGQRVAVIAESDMPGLKGATLDLAKGNQLSLIDELRIWKATLSEERLLSNMYNTIDTSDMYSRGLIAYYPFEKDSTINGVKTKGETLKNMAPRSVAGNAGDMVAPDATMVRDTPPLKNAPSETRITAVPVASERQVVINLAQTEVSARDLEGTTLNITMAEIHDLHGNMSDPIRWTAYVQQNTLLWAKDSVTIFKQYGDDYSFDVDIQNLSGQIEYYTVANMPEWLTLVGSGSTDDVQPLKTKTLRFVVNPLVPVGDYDVTIGLQGNNEILEPLRIVMKVRGETPDWTVDPTLYDHSMTIIGQVYIGGILMENSESLVAAFIGGECRGVASPQEVRGAAYVTLVIYGQDKQTKDAGKPISFRIWHASKGVAYTDARISVEGKDTTVLFHDGTLVGNFDAPAIWTKSDKVEQLIPVHENWNWITFGVQPETQYCDLLFADYSGWSILLKDTASYIQSNGAEWRGTLTPVVNRMYKMQISRTPATQSSTLNTQLSIHGQQLETFDMPVDIAPGWNWLPYTPLTTKRVRVALAALHPERGDIIKSQTEVAIYGYYGWEGTLTALEPGHGYLYFSADTTRKSFVYPEEFYIPGVMGAPMRAMANMNSWFTPVDKHLYPSNMTMTIRLLDGETVVDTCEIAAFVGEECRGAVRAVDSLYYLVISGEGAGQAMTIRSVLNGEVVTIDDTQTFVSDDHIGTPWAPYVINLQRSDLKAVPADNGDALCPKKVLRNGTLYILMPDGTVYTGTGKKVK